MHSSDHMEPQLETNCNDPKVNLVILLNQIRAKKRGKCWWNIFWYAQSMLHFDVVHVKALCKSFCRRSARSSLVSGAFGWKRSSCMMPAWQGLHQFSSSQVWKPKPNSSQLARHYTSWCSCTCSRSFLSMLNLLLRNWSILSFHDARRVGERQTEHWNLSQIGTKCPKLDNYSQRTTSTQPWQHHGNMWQLCSGR